MVAADSSSDPGVGSRGWLELEIGPVPSQRDGSPGSPVCLGRVLSLSSRPSPPASLFHEASALEASLGRCCSSADGIQTEFRYVS